MQRKALIDVCDAILYLEGEMAKYAAVTTDESFIDRWEKLRNEYLSLLTYLDKNG